MDVGNNVYSIHIFYTINIDLSPPKISLDLPLNNTLFVTKDINFSFNATDEYAAVQYCQLYINDSVCGGFITPINETGLNVVNKKMEIKGR